MYTDTDIDTHSYIASCLASHRKEKIQFQFHMNIHGHFYCIIIQIGFYGLLQFVEVPANALRFMNIAQRRKNQDISLANHFSGSHTHAIRAYVRVRADFIFCYMSIKNRTVNISLDVFLFVNYMNLAQENNHEYRVAFVFGQNPLLNTHFDWRNTNELA